VNIYELGLIYEVRPEISGMVHVTMTLTAPNCPAAGILPGQVESQARAAEGVKDVKLDLVFDPPWTPDRMSEAARLELGML
jgi:metal-sulfur cluster biosynthetic enzyme